MERLMMQIDLKQSVRFYIIQIFVCLPDNKRI